MYSNYFIKRVHYFKLWQLKYQTAGFYIPSDILNRYIKSIILFKFLEFIIFFHEVGHFPQSKYFGCWRASWQCKTFLTFKYIKLMLLTFSMQYFLFFFYPFSFYLTAYKFNIIIETYKLLEVFTYLLLNNNGNMYILYR